MDEEIGKAQMILMINNKPKFLSSIKKPLLRVDYMK
jgi:hypothetical protein